MPCSKLVIPAAGLGTRGLPFTKVVPKELSPIIDRPTIDIIAQEGYDAGFQELVLITSRGKHQLSDYFDTHPLLEETLLKKNKTALHQKLKHSENLLNVFSLRQPYPRGLGDAVLCAESITGNETFAVGLGDEIFPDWAQKTPGLTLKTLKELAAETQKSVIAVKKIPREQTSSYGIINFEKTIGKWLTVKSAIEKPSPDQAPSDLAIVGRYVFQAEIHDELKQLSPGAGGEIQLTDALNSLARQNKLIAIEAPEERFDIGSPLGYLSAQISYGMSREDLKEPLSEWLSQLIQNKKL